MIIPEKPIGHTGIKTVASEKGGQEYDGRSTVQSRHNNLVDLWYRCVIHSENRCENAYNHSYVVLVGVADDMERVSGDPHDVGAWDRLCNAGNGAFVLGCNVCSFHPAKPFGQMKGEL